MKHESNPFGILDYDDLTEDEIKHLNDIEEYNKKNIARRVDAKAKGELEKNHSFLDYNVPPVMDKMIGVSAEGQAFLHIEWREWAWDSGLEPTQNLYLEFIGYSWDYSTKKQA